MQISAPAIIVSVRAHGEHGAVVRAMTELHGLVAGYVQGGRSRRVRPVLSAGNIVAIELRSRRADQLGSMKAELVKSRAPLLHEPLAAAAVEWVTALAAVALPEGHPYPAIYSTLDAILVAIESAPSARHWVAAVSAYERVILRDLGYERDAQAIGDTGKRLAEDLLTGWRADILPARARLIDRIDRAMGRA